MQLSRPWNCNDINHVITWSVVNFIPHHLLIYNLNVISNITPINPTFTYVFLSSEFRPDKLMFQKLLTIRKDSIKHSPTLIKL